MSLHRRIRGVLKDKSGIATSMPEAIAGIGLQAIIITAVGGVLATLLAFWAVSTASADTSSGFQNTDVVFSKAVRASDVVVGIDSNRVGLLEDVSGDRCQVQTWQNGTRDGKTTLQVDTTTVDGVCTPTTPLLAAGSSADTRELLYDIKTPAFAYTNLGGREITFNASGTPTLTTGAKPADVKQSDWDDVRPYKVALKLQALSDNTAAVTKSAVETGFTNVVNVTAAADSLRYVPAPDGDPIPGPLTITNVQRSKTTGDVYAGAHEGLTVTFNGAVCPSGPTKVDVSYTQQSPSPAPVVNTVLNRVLTGGATSVDLGSVPNGSDGAVEVAATCIDGGVVVKQSTGFTQTVPATTLTVTQNPTAQEKHELSWIPVSSLPTQFELRWSVGTIDDQLLTTTDQLAYESVNTPGANLGLTTTYTIVASVGTNKSEAATGSITNPLPQAPATVVTASDSGADWDAITCPNYSTAQYAARYYQQTGTDTSVSWSSLSAWSTSRTLAGVTTPDYGRTVIEVQSRCVADKSDAISPTATSDTDAFYAPEAISLTAARSTTAGTAYQGAHEGVLALYSGARCYNGTPTSVSIDWQPVTPTGQSDVSMAAPAAVLTGGSQSLNLANVRNGAEGNLVASATCTAGKSATGIDSVAYTQSLPAPALSVTQGTSVNQHVLNWTAVSSLPTTFQVSKKAVAGTENASPVQTTALTQTFDYSDGVNYGNKTDYVVTATVGNVSANSPTESITGAWPTAPAAAVIQYTRTGAGGLYQGGTITWGYNTSCPAGTTQMGNVLENRTGQSNGTISTAIRATSPWSVRPTSYTWAPSYSLQGYKYAVGIDAKCVSNATAIESPTLLTESTYFITAMQQPGTPVWNSYRTSDGIRGATYMASSTTGNFVVDYATYCRAGSWVNWSNWTSLATWVTVGSTSYNHPFGYADYWYNRTGRNQTATYYNAKYSCATPFLVGPQSNSPGSTVVTIGY